MGAFRRARVGMCRRYWVTVGTEPQALRVPVVAANRVDAVKVARVIGFKGRMKAEDVGVCFIDRFCARAAKKVGEMGEDVKE